MINLYSGCEYVINPWFIYLAEIITGIKAVIIVISVITMAMSIGKILMVTVFYEDEIHGDMTKKSAKKWLAAGWLILIFAMTIPSGDTLYKMAIAKALTPEKAQVIYEETGKTPYDILNEIIENKGE